MVERRLDRRLLAEARDLPLGPIVSYGRAVWDPSGKRVIFDEPISVATLSSNDGAGFFSTDG